MIEFLDDIDFFGELLGGGDRVTQGWVSAGVEFLDTGWGTLAMSLLGVGLILLAGYRKPGRIYLTKLAERTPLVEDRSMRIVTSWALQSSIFGMELF